MSVETLGLCFTFGLQATTFVLADAVNEAVGGRFALSRFLRVALAGAAQIDDLGHPELYFLRKASIETTFAASPASGAFAASALLAALPPPAGFAEAGGGSGAG